MFVRSDSSLLLCLANLTPLLGRALLYTTLLLGMGLLGALLVGGKRLSLLSLLYRSLLVGTALLGVAALTPARESRAVWRMTLPPYATPQPPLPATTSAPALAAVSASASPNSTLPNGLPSAPPQGGSFILPRDQGTKPALLASNLGPSHPSPSHAAVTNPITPRVPVFAALVGGLWMVVVATRGGWLLFGQVCALHLRRQSRPVEDAAALRALERESSRLWVVSPQLLMHPQVQVPFLFGLRHPAIMLPSGYAAEFEEAELDVVFAHELSHLARRDCWWKNAASLLSILLWMQPLLWVLRRRMEATDEALCDAAVLHSGYPPRQYAGILLSLAERVTWQNRGPATAVGMVGFRSALGQRIQRIMSHEPLNNRRVSFAVRAVAVAIVWGAIVFVPRMVSLSAAPASSKAQAKARINTESTAWKTQPYRYESHEGLPSTLTEALRSANSAITGRVLYEDGRPAAGLKVEAYSRLLSEIELWGYKRQPVNHYRWPASIEKLLSGRAVTGADGRYRIGGLLPRRYSVHLQPDHIGNRAPQGWLTPDHGTRVATVAREWRQANDIVLRRGALIQIRVLDAATGVPIQGIRAMVFNVANVDVKQPHNSHVDAYRNLVPMNRWDYAGNSDKNGLCILTLDAGKAYFYLDGGRQAGFLDAAEYRNPKSKARSSATLTSQGVYKIEDWFQVVAPGQAPRRAWKGETTLDLTTSKTAIYTIRLTRARALVASEQQWLHRSITPRPTLRKVAPQPSTVPDAGPILQRLVQARRDLDQAQRFFPEVYMGRIAAQIKIQNQARRSLQNAEVAFREAMQPNSTLAAREHAIKLVQTAVQAVQMVHSGNVPGWTSVPSTAPHIGLPPDWPKTFAEAQQDSNTTLVGRVLYEDGKPVVGATVSFYSKFTGQGMDDPVWGYRRTLNNGYSLPKSIDRLFTTLAVTDATGTYRVGKFVPTAYGVALYGDPKTKRLATGWTEPTTFVGTKALNNRVNQMPDYVLKRGAVVRLRVVDRSTGAPLPRTQWTGYNLAEEGKNEAQSRGRDAAGESRTWRGWTPHGMADDNGYCTLTLLPGQAYCYMNEFGGYSDGRRSFPRTPERDDAKAALLTKYRWWPSYRNTDRGAYLWPNWCQVSSIEAANRRAWCGETAMNLKKGQTYNMTVYVDHTGAIEPGDEEFLKSHLKSRPH